jgi:UDP-N-acetylglucosamine--N-acetylmuramyl-(pentapeptide) pyrophosphoryl-undecaprenol N-acetylglucosamine transferase
MNDKQPLRIMVMAGGTGGHVFPALAVADELRARGVEVSWLGTRQGLEAEVVPSAGFPIDYVQVSGLRGKGALSLLMAPLKLLWALAQSVKIITQRKPAAVLGMGGFVTGPGGLAAWLQRRPLLIHEQNARAGLTNRLLAPCAQCVMEAFSGTFKHTRGAAEKVRHTGNPLRKTFVEAVPGEVAKRAAGQPLRLLVVGGSLGAAKFNEVVPQALAALGDAQRPEVWHQAGKRNIESARDAYAAAGIDVRLEPFIDDMAKAYTWADVVLCRAGAMTIAELAAAGVASVLVPFPFAVDDHQTANARFLADAQAAILLPQGEFSAERLDEILCSLTPGKIKAMAEAARKLALLDATTQVVEQCLAVAQGMKVREVGHG